MDWEDVKKSLFILTNDLQPLPSITTPDHILAARKDVAIALNNRQESFGVRPIYEEEKLALRPSQWEPFEAAKPTDPPVPGQIAFWRTVGVSLPSENLISLNNIIGLEPTITHGPFLDAFDRRVFIDVFRPIPVREFAFPNHEANMCTSSALTPTGLFQSTLGPGVVWIRANLFAPSAPKDSFFGLKIVSGLMFNRPVAPTPMRLSLKLDGTATNSSLFSITPVTDVSFSFAWPTGSTATATLTSISTGQVVAWNSTFKMQQGPPGVLFDEKSGRLDFSMAVDSLTFQPLQNVSGLLNIGGTSTVITASWSVATKLFSEKNFYSVSVPGGFSIALKRGVRVNVKGEPIAVTLDDFRVVVQPDTLYILGNASQTPLNSRKVALGKASSPGSDNNVVNALSIQPNQDTPFYYQATLNGTESWTINANMSFTLDQPRTVNNDRIPFESTSSTNDRWNSLTWFHEPQSPGTRLVVQGRNNLNAQSVSYALKNLLIKADLPTNIEVAGAFEGGLVISGKARIISHLRYTLPFLPDPYVTNFALPIDAAMEKQGLGYITVTVAWNDTGPPTLDLDLMATFITAASIIPRANASGRRDDPVYGEIITRKRDYWDLTVLKNELDSGLIPDFGLGALFHLPKPGGVEGVYFHPPTLLDVSSNSAQFGVVFGTRTLARDVETMHVNLLASGAGETREFQISDMMLAGSAEDIRVMTLPAVHWEAVTEADINTVPATPLEPQSYKMPYSGPSAQIAIRNETTPFVRLVPVAPKEAIENLLSQFNSTDPEGVADVAARFSLPFGMVALTKMSNRLELFRTAAKIGKVEFKVNEGEDIKTKLTPPELQPAHQLTFTPPMPRRLFLPPGTHLPNPSPRLLVANADPSFDGVTTFLKMNVRPKPNEMGDILGEPAAGFFLSDMADKVPLRRFDLSGYGASIFSDWRRVLGPSVDSGVTKVLMNVITGRTSREVINVESVKAPFGVTVIKTIEIKRLNNGAIVRYETEWEPTSEGRYFYKNPDILTHIGVIRGVTEVRNIREFGLVTVPGTQHKVIKVKFDCIAEIEDGGVPQKVPLRDIDGCIFAEVGELQGLEGVRTYMAVLEKMNLGGKVDFTVQIGQSGQKKRITSLSVTSGLDPTSQKSVAVAAAWGSAIFEGGGQWSFAKLVSGVEQIPQAVDMAKGVPLVREGLHNLPNLNTLTTSYLFKEPGELLKSAPQTIYGIIHGAGSHRVLFKSPEISFAQDAKGILSSEVLVAHSLALGKSTGIFPNLNDCLKVDPGLAQGAKQLLGIVEGGYVFEPKKFLDGSSQLDLPDITRTFKDDASIKTVVQTVNAVRQGSDDVKSTLSLAINTAKNISKMDITNIKMVTSTVSQTTNEASILVGRLSSDVSKVAGLLGADPSLPDVDPGSLLDSPLHKFGPALARIQKVISFLESLKYLPNFKVSMTNEWAMLLSTSMNREDLMQKIPEPTRPPVERIIESFDFTLTARTSLSSFLLKMHVGTTIKIPTGFPPVVAIGKGAFDVALGTSGVDIKLQLGFGIGVDFSLGPFSVSASFTQSQTVLFNEDSWGVGITACMRAHVDLVIASADLYLEAKLSVVGGECKEHQNHHQTTIYAFAQVKIAVHVSIFLVCNIGVEEEAGWQNNFNDGPCQLEKMSDLVVNQ